MNTILRVRERQATKIMSGYRGAAKACRLAYSAKYCTVARTHARANYRLQMAHTKQRSPSYNPGDGYSSTWARPAEKDQCDRSGQLDSTSHPAPPPHTRNTRHCSTNEKNRKTYPIDSFCRVNLKKRLLAMLRAAASRAAGVARVPRHAAAAPLRGFCARNARTS